MFNVQSKTDYPLLNLLISITWSLFSLLVALVHRHLSPSLVHHHLPLSKSQIALSVMHHPLFGIIFLSHSVNHVHRLSPPSHVPSITSSLFHSRLKTRLFHKSFPPQIFFYTHRTATELQPHCLHGLRTTQRYVLVLSLSSFSWRGCRTKPVFGSFLITRK